MSKFESNKFVLSILIFGIFTVPGYCDIFSDIKMFEEQGGFQQATNLIDNYLIIYSTTNDTDRKSLLFAKDKLYRIKLDYNKTKDNIINSLATKVRNFQTTEFYDWDNQGYFDKKIIDGTTYYFSSGISNLFFRYKDIYDRAVSWQDLGTEARNQLNKCKSIISEYETTQVNKITFTLKVTMNVYSGAVPGGKTVRCWMPYPLEMSRQKNISLIASSPQPKSIVSANSLIGYLYFEKAAVSNQATVFTADFKVASSHFYLPIDYQKIEPYDTQTDEVYKEYIKPRNEHETQSTELCNLVTSIIGNETNPYRKAKLVYDWIANNIQYSYAREYSTIDNLSKYTYDHRYGDCGQQGMLFVTLCKIAGVPARWQSGWVIESGSEGLHDWCEIYVRPYGWIPVDMYWGSFARHYGYGLSPDEINQLADFYFGNIDNYRLVVNNNHSIDLSPAKNSFRSEIVDFQRGELEYDTTNLYFDKFYCSLNVSNYVVEKDTTVPIIVTGSYSSSGNSFISGDTVNVTIRGINFDTNPVVKLVCGAQTIDATQINRVNYATIICVFNLANVPPGKWDVVVQNQDGRQGRLTGGFVVVANKLIPTDLDNVRVYPNPCKCKAENASMTFSRLTKDAEINIYTVNGELVRTLDNTAGDDIENWDTTNESDEKVASGIYFFVVTDSSDHKKTGKLAIIR